MARRGYGRRLTGSRAARIVDLTEFLVNLESQVPQWSGILAVK